MKINMKCLITGMSEQNRQEEHFLFCLPNITFPHDLQQKYILYKKIFKYVNINIYIYIKGI